MTTVEFSRDINRRYLLVNAGRFSIVTLVCSKDGFLEVIVNGQTGRSWLDTDWYPKQWFEQHAVPLDFQNGWYKIVE